MARRTLLLLTLSVACLAAPASALSLYAVIPANGTLAGDLWLVDPVNGNQLIGRPVAQGLSGLAADSSGNLYASTFVTGSGSSLIQIDPQDGSLLGSVAILDSLGSPMAITDLAMQPGTDVLYATSVITDGLNQKLYTIDVATGVASLVGDTGIYATGGGPIGFAPDGTLYYADWDAFTFELRLHRLDPVTGQRIIGSSSPFGGGDGSLAVGPDGLIYTTPALCCSFGRIWTVDPDAPETPALYAQLGSSVGVIGDLAFLPEPSLIALLGAGLALAAGAQRTRRA
jgi:outer membrane protein assembly factor BamB